MRGDYPLAAPIDDPSFFHAAFLETLHAYP